MKYRLSAQDEVPLQALSQRQWRHTPLRQTATASSPHLADHGQRQSRRLSHPPMLGPALFALFHVEAAAVISRNYDNRQYHFHLT